MKLLPLLILSTFTNVSLGQVVVQGTVQDQNGNGVPGARVAISNTTQGVPTNYEGKFIIELDYAGDVGFAISMIGYEKLFETVKVDEGRNEVVFQLKASNKALSSVEIYSDKRDIAKEIMKKVIAKRKLLFKQYKSYKCTTYVKTTLESVARKKTEKDSILNKEQFIEKVSVAKHIWPDKYQELTIAKKDYSDEITTQVESDGLTIMPFARRLLLRNFLREPDEVPDLNRYTFFDRLEDGDLNIYESNISLPKISPRVLISPLSSRAFINYKFSLASKFYNGEENIWEIDVTPRFSGGALFSGKLFIVDSLWVVKSFDLKINKAALLVFSDLRIIQDYNNLDNMWLPVRREYEYKINERKKFVFGNTRVFHSDYQFNQEHLKGGFNGLVEEIKDDAFEKDAEYWRKERPIALKTDELAYIEERDSILQIVNSEPYLDSINRLKNLFKLERLLLTGLSHTNREKEWFIRMNGLIPQFQLFGVGGVRYTPTFTFAKKLENARSFSVLVNPDYGFANNDFFGVIRGTFNYAPKHFGSLSVWGGGGYDLITTSQNFAQYFSTQNTIRKTMFGISNRYELFNGFNFIADVDYSRRSSLENFSQSALSDSLISNGIWENSLSFGNYSALILKGEFVYRIKQKYILKEGVKSILPSHSPEISLSFRAGIPSLLNSQVHFNQLTMKFVQQINIGAVGKLDVNIAGGSYFGKNIDQIRLIDQQFFRQSDPFYFFNPLQNQQRLDTSIATTEPYFQAYFKHNFNGFIMGKIPLIGKLKLKSTIGGSTLSLLKSGFRNNELYFLIDRPFKTKHFDLELGIGYVFQEGTRQSQIAPFKFSLNLKSITF